ncbi:phospholipase D family protein [Shimia abyssi]|uniref:Phospholipase D-like protein n=1 Tax=Shimia abyssi TaxID=1662395 RepID=A0A2P8FIW7_9RHOB|nr:phospholipase D family protein [Shimia abyssi]PSL21647.1 phospholipase D-like protein [Shimia abyssi]
MKLFLGAINGNYLRNITENAAKDTEEVLAAVAYATDNSLLFDWCIKHDIPLKFYGRLDPQVAVNTNVLSKFLNRKSAKFTCKLVKNHHAKVIWWRGYGIYVGSANLTDSAWNRNVEAGFFIKELDIDDKLASDILQMFSVLDKNATPLTQELFDLMVKRQKDLASKKADDKAFWDDSSVNNWSGLVTTSPIKAKDAQRDSFLAEWFSTLQILRDISSQVILPENRPTWITDEAPSGAQADQFLHAFYYQKTFEEQKARYLDFFDRNKSNPDKARADALRWWAGLKAAPQGEDVMLNTTAPFLRNALAQENLAGLKYDDFREVCSAVHSIKDYARRVRNNSVGLPSIGAAYNIPEKVAALSNTIWEQRTEAGLNVKEVLSYIFYGGKQDELPNRLWQAINDPKFKIDGLGISALGELVGWALPDIYPPRNGRTSKALKALGYDVTVHVQ